MQLKSVIALAAMGFSCNAIAQAITVVEYHHKDLDIYFMTGREAEKQLLDGLPAIFSRTGMSFQAVDARSAPSSLTQICRFYISLAEPYTSTHFYGRKGVDCEGLQASQPPGFQWEDYDFAIQQSSNDVCPAGTTAVYRGFRAAAGGKSPNHRYTVSNATSNAALAAGYIKEGAPFCATSVTDAASVTPPISGSDCGTFYYPNNRITYQTNATSAGAPQSYTKVRTYDANPTSFAGRSVTRVIDTLSDGSSSTMMLEEQTSSWTWLGSQTVGVSGSQNITLSPAMVYPRTMSTGQRLDINHTVNYDPALPFVGGQGTQQGYLQYIGKEQVTVPAGTFEACKFTSDTSTTVGSSISTREEATSWVAIGVGTVKSVVKITSSTMGFSQTTNAEEVATQIEQ